MLYLKTGLLVGCCPVKDYAIVALGVPGGTGLGVPGGVPGGFPGGVPGGVPGVPITGAGGITVSFCIKA